MTITNTEAVSDERLAQIAANKSFSAGEIVAIATELLSRRAANSAGGVEVFDMAAHLQRQRDWSGKTFGPGPRTAGVVDHIRKELREIEADPSDITEWIDVVILALDGAWRAGYQPQEIIDAMVAKQTRNEGRNWPDWRTMSPDKAIEHDRSGEASAPAAEAEPVAWQWSDFSGKWYTVDTARMSLAEQEELARAVAKERGGRVRPCFASSPVSAEVTEQVATAMKSAQTLLFGLGLRSGEEYYALTDALAALNGKE